MSTLSVYASPWHRHPQYLAYVAALQPAWIRLHQPQAFDLSELQRVAPNARIMLRQWDFDDNDGQRKAELYADPRGAALKLIERWDDKADALESELRSRGLPYDRSRWWFGTWNEPDPAHVPQIVEGNAEAMRLAGLRGMRLGVVCASVGNFAKPEEGPHGWAAFAPLEQPINEGGHILICHEYWQREGPAGVWIDAQGNERHDAGNLAWRHRSIPLNVPILIGEAGANGYIYGRFSGNDDCGWRSVAMGLSAARYAAQVRQYIEGCDSRVQGVCLYMSDYHSGQWASFDTLDAHGELLRVADAQPQVAAPGQSVTVSLPIVRNGSAGVANDLFPEVMKFVSRWEGGFVNNPVDPGGATNMGITIGTLSAWRQAHGLPAATVDDVRNLTREEADAIYRAWYWEPSGAADAPDYATALLLMDSGVLHGVGAAQAWVREYGHDPFAIAGRRLKVYTDKDATQWGAFGRGWTRRTGELLAEIGRAQRA